MLSSDQCQVLQRTSGWYFEIASSICMIPVDSTIPIIIILTQGGCGEVAHRGDKICWLQIQTNYTLLYSLYTIHSNQQAANSNQCSNYTLLYTLYTIHSTPQVANSNLCFASSVHSQLFTINYYDDLCIINSALQTVNCQCKVHKLCHKLGKAHWTILWAESFSQFKTLILLHFCEAHCPARQLNLARRWQSRFCKYKPRQKCCWCAEQGSCNIRCFKSHVGAAEL